MFELKKKTLIYCAVVACLVLLLVVLIPAFRKPTLNTLKYPLGLFNAIRREAGGIIFYHRNLLENEKLKKEKDLFIQKLNSYDEADSENKRLKDLLSLKQEVPYKLIAAKVIGRAVDNWSSLIIIDKGSSSGIKRAMAVINTLGLVGRVMETSKTLSKVMLINDPNLSVSAVVKRSRQEGIISGSLGSSLMMKFLPKDADIAINDTIITSGLNKTYPKGLLVGTVVDIGDEFSGLTRYAIIKPAVNLSSIEEVLIVVP